jgi:hypothetical protein
MRAGRKDAEERDGRRICPSELSASSIAESADLSRPLLKRQLTIVCGKIVTCVHARADPHGARAAFCFFPRNSFVICRL